MLHVNVCKKEISMDVSCLAYFAQVHDPDSHHSGSSRLRERCLNSSVDSRKTMF